MGTPFGLFVRGLLIRRGLGAAIPDDDRLAPVYS